MSKRQQKRQRHEQKSQLRRKHLAAALHAKRIASGGGGGAAGKPQRKSGKGMAQARIGGGSRRRAVEKGGAQKGKQDLVEARDDDRKARAGNDPRRDGVAGAGDRDGGEERRESAGGSPATGEEQARAAGGVEGSGVGGEDAAGMGRERGDERGAMEEGLQGGDGGGGGDGGTSVRVVGGRIAGGDDVGAEDENGGRPVGVTSGEKRGRADEGEGEGEEDEEEREGRGDEQEDEEEDEEEDDAARKGKKSERVEEPSGLRGFHPSQRILLVGEGDFSFTRALLRLMAPARPLALFATALDSRHTIVQKYGEEAGAVLQEVEGAGAHVLFNVDATRLAHTLHLGKRRRKGKANPLEKPFDRIVFNFPHVGLGIKDERINVQRNRQLLFDFFVSAAPLLAPQGEVRVSLRTGHPYSLWNAPALAEESRALRLKFTHRFHRDDFPGYAHRRTIGGKTGLMVENTEEGSKAAGAKTFVFCHRNAHLPRSANAGVAGRKKMR